jgi:hypothetical protein
MVHKGGAGCVPHANAKKMSLAQASKGKSRTKQSKAIIHETQVQVYAGAPRGASMFAYAPECSMVPALIDLTNSHQVSDRQARGAGMIDHTDTNEHVSEFCKCAPTTGRTETYRTHA